MEYKNQNYFYNLTLEIEQYRKFMRSKIADEGINCSFNTDVRNFLCSVKREMKLFLSARVQA